VKFQLLADTFTLTPDETFPINTIIADTNTLGVISVTLASGLNTYYRVTMPDGETFTIYIPVDSGAPTTLESLRSFYSGIIPTSPPGTMGPTGPAGTNGTGDLTSNTAVSVDSEIILFSGTLGKTAKRATTTGILKGTAGVLSAAISGTDYLAPGATFEELVDDRVAALHVNSTSVTWTYNDAANSLSGAVITAGTGTAATPSKSDHTHTVTKALNFPFGDEDALGAVIPLTARRMVSIPVGWGTCTITRWRILLDQAATATFDVWKDSYVNYPPLNADSITAAAKPSTTAVIKNESATLTGWTTTFTGGDVLIAEVEANNLAKFALLVIEFTMIAV